MTCVDINAGSCGFMTTITADMSEDKKTIAIGIRSNCESVTKMAENLISIDKMDVFTRFMGNPVYKAADRHLKHVSCPIPSGILKAAEVEAGFNIRSDVSIKFSPKDG